MDIYVNLDRDDYKSFENQEKEFVESVHTTVDGFYHKSHIIRFPKHNLTIEFHGPAVKARE